MTHNPIVIVNDRRRKAILSTTTVRNAVAISESVFFMPYFARIEVIPAKNADMTAMISFIFDIGVAIVSILLLLIFCLKKKKLSKLHGDKPHNFPFPKCINIKKNNSTKNVFFNLEEDITEESANGLSD